MSLAFQVILYLLFWIILTILFYTGTLESIIRKLWSLIRNGNSERKSDDNRIDTFVAVDTETATKNGDVCQIAYVSVENGEIIKQNCYLIQPENNKYDRVNISIHHITPDKTADAPMLDEVWPEIEQEIVKAGAFVAHNADFDINAIQNSLSRYVQIFEKVRVFDTCKMSGYSSLYSCCVYFGIELGEHHDALCDARACAQLLLKLKDAPSNVYIPKLTEPKPKAKKVKKEVEVIYQNTFFTDKTCVISGTFEEWPDREELLEFLMSCGAKLTQSLSNRTDYFIIGEEPGPSKMKKALELSSHGSPIQFVTESKLHEIIDSIVKSEANKNSA